MLALFLPSCDVLFGGFDAFEGVLTASRVVTDVVDVVDVVVTCGVVVFECELSWLWAVTGNAGACGCLSVEPEVVTAAESCFTETLSVGGVIAVSSPKITKTKKFVTWFKYLKVNSTLLS